MITHQISDLIARINNARNNLKSSKIDIIKTKDNLAIISKLEKEGFITVLPLDSNTTSYQTNGRRSEANPSNGGLARANASRCEGSSGRANEDLDRSKFNPKTITISINTINKIKVLSTPGRRLYRSWKDLHQGNSYIMLIRTSKGILSSSEAIINKLGGELLLKIS